MRIAVLSRNSALYSTSRLVLTARSAGHEVQVIDPLAVHVMVHDKKNPLWFDGSPLGRIDGVIPRIGASVTRYGSTVIRELERSGATVLNGGNAIALARDKVESLQLLSRNRIAVPPTVCLRSLQGLDTALKQVGPYPIVVKLQNGTQGIGTMIAESRASLQAMLQTFCAMGHEVMLQRFIKSAKGADIRAFVVGGKVIAAMRRQARSGEFRSNLHRGGSSEAIKLDRRYKRCAIKAASLIGLDVSGVDMLESKDGPIIVEVNASPGFEGLEASTQIDVATPVVAHLENRIRQQRQQRTERRRKARR